MTSPARALDLSDLSDPRTCSHCFCMPYTEPLPVFVVLRDGYTAEQCCRCHAVRTVERIPK